VLSVNKKEDEPKGSGFWVLVPGHLLTAANPVVDPVLDSAEGPEFIEGSRVEENLSKGASLW
jgi:hypothetical protein